METAAMGSRVIRVEGTFDVPAARRLADAVAAAPADEDLEVDLTGVREFHDFSVAVLAQALTGAGPHIAVRGLARHHVRLLRYLGVAARPDADYSFDDN